MPDKSLQPTAIPLRRLPWPEPRRQGLEMRRIVLVLLLFSVPTAGALAACLHHGVPDAAPDARMYPYRPSSSSSVSTAQPALAQGSPARNIVTQMLDVMPGVAIAYCSSRLPELRPQLKSAEAAFDGRIIEAATPFIEKLRQEHPREPGIPEPQVAAIRQKITAELRMVDSRTYCPALIAKLKSVDADTFMSNVRRTYRQYLDASRKRADGSKN